MAGTKTTLDWHRILATRRGHAVPLHVQLKEAFRQAVASLPPGSALPSEPELVIHTGLSRATVRRALEELARLGVVETRRGRGSFTAYGLAPEQGEESVFAVNADREVATLLAVPVAFALLASVRVSQAAGGVRLEYTRRYVQPDLCGYRVRLEGNLQIRS